MADTDGSRRKENGYLGPTHITYKMVNSDALGLTGINKQRGDTRYARGPIKRSESSRNTVSQQMAQRKADSVSSLQRQYEARRQQAQQSVSSGAKSSKPSSGGGKATKIGKTGGSSR